MRLWALSTMRLHIGKEAVCRPGPRHLRSILKDTVTKIILRRGNLSLDHALLVGVSGIDAGGKDFISRKLADELESAGYRVALINIDGWLNLPPVRFSSEGPGRHFYEHALRLDEAFRDLIIPLRQNRWVDIETDHTEETAHEYWRHRYSFENIDIVLVEGIFLFKKRFAGEFDLRIWVDCSFEKALQRAIRRGQEGKDPSATIADYNVIYFPAQQHHFTTDNPIATSDIIIPNERDE